MFLVTVLEQITSPIIGQDVADQHYTENVNLDYEEVMAGAFGTWSGEGGVSGVTLNVVEFADHIILDKA